MCAAPRPHSSPVTRTVRIDQSPRLPLCVLIAIVLTGVAGQAAQASDGQKPDGQKKVLVVYSVRRDTQLAAIGDREFPRLLQEGLRTTPDYYSEYLDAARFPDPQYGAAFNEYLKLKYSGARFDLVVAANKLAFEFIAANRDQLFPVTPIVFFSEDRTTRRIPNSAGLVIEPDHRGTITLARQLQPELQHVFVVLGSSGRDKALGAVLSTQFESFAPGLTFTYMTDQTIEDLERQIANLPERSIVYYALFYQDAEGVNVNPLEYLTRLSGIANRPMYSWVDSAMDRGIVGGSLLTLESQIRALAALALRVLNGERADDIALASANLNVSQVDWRQLQRWGINQYRVPAGTVVKFQEPSPFVRYRPYILGAVALFIAQAALIAGLLLQSSRRRRAEERARSSEGDLRDSYERIRDLSRRLLVAQDDERSRLARELHDDVGQQLTLLALDLGALKRGEDGRNDRVKLSEEALDRTYGIAKSLHDISYRLHPQKLRLLGLVAAIAGIRRDLPKSEINVTFTHENVPAVLPPDLSLCLYRIAQEAVQNAFKHSGAREIAIRLAGDADRLTLTIDDDGVGFDPASARGQGLGLLSMSERLEPFGGALSIRSTPGTGTRVEAVVDFALATAVMPPGIGKPA
jgi:signal transduction histidine kinase